MSYDILSVKFEVDSPLYENGQFSVPIEVCSALDVKPGDNVSLTIENPMGKPFYTGVKTIGLHTKIHGSDLSNCVKAGQRITVTLARLYENNKTIL